MGPATSYIRLAPRPQRSQSERMPSPESLRERDDLVVEVGDLVGHAGRIRDVSGSRQASLRLGESKLEGPLQVDGRVVGTLDGVQAEFSASGSVHLSCVRCLAEWDEQLEVSGSQHFSIDPDEDGYAIEGTTVDVFGPAQDEFALDIPVAPLCQDDCRGLCPICGSDLNSDPCDGHGEDSDSPFAVLKDLLDS